MNNRMVSQMMEQRCEPEAPHMIAIVLSMSILFLECWLPAPDIGPHHLEQQGPAGLSTVKECSMVYVILYGCHWPHG